MEALNSDLRTQISFKDDQLANLQKVMEEQKVILSSRHVKRDRDEIEIVYFELPWQHTLNCRSFTL